MTGADRLPTIAVSIGDACGIGPELVARLVTRPATRARCRPIVVGDPAVVSEALSLIGAGDSVALIARVADAAFEPRQVDVLAPSGSEVPEMPRGQVDAAAGRAAAASLMAAVGLGAAGEVDGVISAPINKQALALAGVEAKDELELLREFARSERPFLIGVMEHLWTACVTLHVPLRSVPALVTRDSVLATIHALAAARAGLTRPPRIFVAGLNPHAGDGGLLGDEEIVSIGPAIELARSEGHDVTGPLPPDTVFPVAAANRADGVVCMYHDQANIARKLARLTGQATLILGLPVPLATTAHGTAFDLAGRGIADPGSIEAALDAVLEQAVARGADARV